MTGEALATMARLARLGVELRADGERLRFRPVDLVDHGLRAELAKHKAAILATLAARGAAAPDPAVRPLEQRDASDRAVFEALAGEREVWTPRPRRSIDGLPDGWTAVGWIRRLRYLADACESIRPDLAARHRSEAQRIEEILSNGPPRF